MNDRIQLEPGWEAGDALTAPFKPVDMYVEAARFIKRDAFLRKCDAILGNVRYKHWTICAYPELDGPGAYLQVSFYAPDWPKSHLNYANPAIQQNGRKWRLSEHMTRSEIVQTALAAVLGAEEHENREQFFYKGRAIFGPHFDVERLHEMAGAGATDERPTAPVVAAFETRMVTLDHGRASVQMTGRKRFPLWHTTFVDPSTA